MSDLRNAAVTPEEAHTETDAPRARRVGYKGASQHTGLPVGTLKQKVHRRAIPHLRLGPRLVRFDLDDLDRWLEEHKVAPAGAR